MNRTINKWLLLFIVSSAIFLSVIDLFIVNVALPSIKEGIKGSDGDIQLVIVLYVIGYAAFLVMGGRAGDHFGKRRVFISGILIFTLASCTGGFAQNAWQLNISRLAQGVSAAFMVPQGVAFIPIIFPEPKEREKALGIYGSIAGTASVIGQFLGGILPDTHLLIAGWRLIFLINLPVGLVAAFLAYRFLNDDKRDRRAKKKGSPQSLTQDDNFQIPEKPFFNIWGVLLLMLTLIAFIYPLIQGRELNWPGWSILLLLSSIPLLFAFIYNQQKCLRLKKEPLINFSLFNNRYFVIGLLAAVFYYMVQDSYFLINAMHLQNGLHISSSTTGIYFVFQGLGYVVASFLSIKLVLRFGKWVLITGVFFMITSLLLHLLVLQGDPQITMVLPVLFVYGMGCGSVLPTMFTMSLKNIAPQLAGSASGLYLTIQQVSIALGVGIIGGIFFNLLGSDAASPYDAYRIATMANIGLLVFVALICFLFPSHRSTDQ
ncbi:MFS transporter [Olivibacter sp. CPCC 100613]|uniref:MFS transporter n=1 Tax=Olivibacter sp. CPCC 100613 TaxID=3079931 RepID=UPI002FF49574